MGDAQKPILPDNLYTSAPPANANDSYPIKPGGHLGDAPPPPYTPASGEIPVAPIAEGVPIAFHGQNSTWSTGLFDCMLDFGGCCEMWWCTYCQHARTYNRLEKGSQEINLPFCVGECLVDSSSGGCGTAAATWYLRDRIRHRYGIAGTNMKDACVSLCCTLCASCQNDREMVIRREPPGGCCTKEELEGYSLAAPPMGTHNYQPMGQ